jgi:hypothetical protein
MYRDLITESGKENPTLLRFRGPILVVVIRFGSMQKLFMVLMTSSLRFAPRSKIR